MGTTARWGTPYPDGGDTPAVHADMQEMAESLDDVAKDLQGLLAARPAAAADNYGLYYWATDEELLYRSDGADWQEIGPGSVGTGGVGTDELADDAVTDAKLADHASDDNSRAVGSNHIKDLAVTTGKLATGAVTAAKIAAALKPSGTAAVGDEALRALGTTAGTAAAGNDSRLSAGAAGVATVRALGTGSTEAAAGDDVRITSAFGGKRLAVRGVAVSNINISAAPATIDGISPTAGDRFLLVNQTDTTQNGIYTWASAGAAMDRALDFNSNAEVVRGLHVYVMDGVAGITKGTVWAITNSSPTLADNDWKVINYFGTGTSTGGIPDALLGDGNLFYETDIKFLYATLAGLSGFQPLYLNGAMLTDDSVAAASMADIAYGRVVGTDSKTSDSSAGASGTQVMTLGSITGAGASSGVGLLVTAQARIEPAVANVNHGLAIYVDGTRVALDAMMMASAAGDQYGTRRPVHYIPPWTGSKTITANLYTASGNSSLRASATEVAWLIGQWA